jgi:manganese transport protein
VAIASSRKRMGEFVNAPWLRIAGWASAIAITAINVLLLVLVATGT